MGGWGGGRLEAGGRTEGTRARQSREERERRKETSLSFEAVPEGGGKDDVDKELKIGIPRARAENPITVAETPKGGVHHVGCSSSSRTLQREKKAVKTIEDRGKDRAEAAGETRQKGKGGVNDRITFVPWSRGKKDRKICRPLEEMAKGSAGTAFCARANSSAEAGGREGQGKKGKRVFLETLRQRRGKPKADGKRSRSIGTKRQGPCKKNERSRRTKKGKEAVWFRPTRAGQSEPKGKGARSI